jgi:hypothetical protein
MKGIALGFAALAAIVLTISSADAAAKGYGSARAACLAQAGTTEAIWRARRATYAQGAIYKDCMTAKGQDVVVLKRDGSRLYWAAAYVIRLSQQAARTRADDRLRDIRDFHSVNPAYRCAHAGYGTTGHVFAPARTAEFLSLFQADLPCPVVAQKIFLFPSDPNHRLIFRHPVPYEGRFAIVTNVGRDAVDAKAPLTNGAQADGEVVWFWRPDAGVKFAMMLRITQAMVTKSRSPRRARNKP